MHRHDLDLMAALADGSLPDDGRARSLVATCPKCRSEYELHRSVLEALRSHQPVAMSSAEKAALHRDVLTRLTSVPGASPARSLWPRLGYAMVGLFLVVGLAAVLSQVGDFSATNDTTGVFAEVSSGLGDDTAAAGPRADFTATTSAATSGEGMFDAAGQDDSQAYMPFVERARKNLTLTAPGTSNTSPVVAKRVMACISQAGLDSSYRSVGEVEETSPYLLVVPGSETVTDDTPITVIDFTTCRIVHVDG